jgi:hypothetical protein
MRNSQQRNILGCLKIGVEKICDTQYKLRPVHYRLRGRGVIVDDLNSNLVTSLVWV